MNQIETEISEPFFMYFKFYFLVSFHHTSRRSRSHAETAAHHEVPVFRKISTTGRAWIHHKRPTAPENVKPRLSKCCLNQCVPAAEEGNCVRFLRVWIKSSFRHVFFTPCRASPVIQTTFAFVRCHPVQHSCKSNGGQAAVV